MLYTIQKHIVSVLSGVLEEKYYYSYSEHQQKCRWDGDPSKLVPVVGYKRVKPDENVMKENLFKNGPLIAAINSKSMGTYTEGIDEPTDEQCDPEELNHSVLIVGYGVTVTPERNVSYWIIKNSWGGDFGDKGFYYLVRGRNACGIASDVSYTFVD
ncbi:uncharacterized protein LOC106133063 [Amyelois transitella]|uniref:uncharacterized protein LOC106133063 n=1 Tax=Amyelois transitella TaxID=680683 RepID=UPI0029904091|nr:uncharacterized protein LOC106133063 [Amyelois transitella]